MIRSHTRSGLAAPLIPARGILPLAVCFALGGAAGGLVLTSPSVHAQQTAVAEARVYEIQPGPLPQVLTDFVEAAGVYIAGTSEMAAGKQSPGVEGRYTADRALTQLLAGTGLRAARSADGSYALEQAETGTLPPVKVRAEAPVPTERSLGYGRKELQAISPRDIKDLFERESNVSVGGSIPMNQKIYVRGVEETALAVTVDGARQNNKVFHHNATNLIDPALLKAVRASAGISPADDGPGAIGGSLVFETVDVADMLSPGASLGGFVDGGYASNGDVLTTAGSLYGRSGGLEVLGFVNKTSGDNYEDGDGDTVAFTEPALVSSLAKVAWESDGAGRFELTHEYVNDDSVRPYRANFTALTAGRPVPESRNYDLTRSNTVFNYNRDTGSGYWNPDVVIANNEAEVQTTEVPLSDPPAVIVYTGTTESFSATLENRFYTKFAEIAAGVDYYDDSALFEFAGDPDLEETAENTGVYAQFRQTLGEVLDLSYGLRYDSQDFTGTDGSSQDDSGVSGNLFAELLVNDHITLKGGYAEVWGGVELAENFILNGGWDYPGGVRPVEASNYTVGIETRFDRLVIEANQYATDIEDGRVPSYRGGAGVVADFDIEGYDLSMGYLGARGEINVQYANIEADKDGEPATSYDGSYFTAPLGELITVNGSWLFPQMRLQLGLNAEMTLDNDAVADSGAEQEGYTVVNVYADYEVIEDLSLRFEIDNLTDESYTDRASYGQEFVTVEPLLEPGRSFVVNARYAF